ncbi:vomeronasal type-1 receptor 1-like [Gracilinanus agilis]|uniref:vomeronasal type-1 receptor 1-like n=1 Tax=Gracilinanus agilis TaxID=191870 RepID=UPI001CFE8C35|nr:vomeronasal type-1 receptor 1-like [Gracilinanus agilis]
MITYSGILGIIYLQVTGVGFLGNCILLFQNIFDFIFIHRTRPKNLIIIQLAFSNAMLLLFRGIQNTTRLWMMKCFLEELGIRIIAYMQTTVQGLSLGSTCILSAFQAITISPNNSISLQLKIRAPKCIITCILLCWIFNLLLYIIILLYHNDGKNNTDNNYGCNIVFKILDMYKNHIKNTILIYVKDAMCVCVITSSSAYMILILCKHKRHMKHIHSNSLSIKISPETRATKAILLLLGTFALFNIFGPIFILYIIYFKYINNWVMHALIFLSLGYPTLSPFILISIHNQIPRICAY